MSNRTLLVATVASPFVAIGGSLLGIGVAQSHNIWGNIWFLTGFALLLGCAVAVVIAILMDSRKRQGKDELRAGRRLAVGQSRRSPRGRSRLNLQEDGNLVICHGERPQPIWATNTAGGGAKFLAMQTDGNLVLYADDGRSLWATNTEGKGGNRLLIQDDGNLVIRTDDGTPVWASITDELRAGQRLTAGQPLNSSGGRFTLNLQEDGNLVICHGERPQPIWATNTAGSGAKFLAMQTDGNLVLYADDGRPVWATDTDGKGGQRLLIQDDGNLVIRTDRGRPIWASDTITH